MTVINTVERVMMNNARCRETDDECSSKLATKELCYVHYKRLRRTGSTVRGRATPSEAARIFVDLLDEAGYVNLEECWLGTKEKHRVLCPQNHSWCVEPESFRRGRRCRICARTDPEASHLAFNSAVREAG